MAINPNLNAGNTGFGQTMAALYAADQSRAATQGQDLLNAANRQKIQAFAKDTKRRALERKLGEMKAKSDMAVLPSKQEADISGNKATTLLNDIKNNNPKLWTALGKSNAKTQIVKNAREQSTAGFDIYAENFSNVTSPKSYKAGVAAMEKLSPGLASRFGLKTEGPINMNDVKMAQGQVAASIKTRQVIAAQQAAQTQFTNNEKLHKLDNTSRENIEANRAKTSLILNNNNTDSAEYIARLNNTADQAIANAKTVGKDLKLSDFGLGDFGKFVAEPGRHAFRAMMEGNGFELEDDSSDHELAVTTALFAEGFSRFEQARQRYNASGHDPRLTPKSPMDYANDVFADMLDPDAPSEGKFIKSSDNRTLTYLSGAFAEKNRKSAERLLNSGKNKANADTASEVNSTSGGSSVSSELKADVEGLSEEEYNTLISDVILSLTGHDSNGLGLPPTPRPGGTNYDPTFNNRGR